MIQWAWKSLFSRRGNLVSSALGIGGAFILVIFFSAVLQGEAVQVVAYPKHIKPDIWVMQKGVANMHMAMSFVWDWKADKVARIPGVKRVTPILYTNGIITTGGQRIFAFIVGLLPGTQQRAGPWEMVAGRQVRSAKETVVPDVFIRLAGVKLGDEVRITDKKFKIVGFSKGTFSSANAVLFVPFNDLQDIISAIGTYSYLLVDIKEGLDPKLMAATIRQQVEKVNALPHQEFIENDFSMAKQMGLEIIFMMTVICSVLAALIIGFTAYSLVVRKRSELAVIKALGTGNGRIFFAVVFQSGLITLLGFLVAVAFAVLVIPKVPALIPQLTLIVSSDTILLLGGIALLVAVAGALIPAYLITRLDPATVFYT